MFDKKLCMENIYAIAKDKGIKIGDLERTAGLSSGYLSKLSKEGNTAVPGIESLLLIAGALGVSIDYLLSVDYKELNGNEKYVIAFIEKLIKGTELRKLSWEIDGAAYLNTNKTGESFEHPLFLKVPSVTEDMETGRFINYTANVYQSRFLRSSEINYFENGYHCELGESGDTLYMMKLCPGDRNYPIEEIDFDSPDISDQPHEEIELYIVTTEGKVSSLCSTYSSGVNMKTMLKKLYSTVFGDGRFISMASETKNIIDRFMGTEW